MDGLLQDLRYALHQFKKVPALAVTVVLTIALGVGANAALFSIVNGVLLNPLRYPEPEQLMTLHESKANFETGSISYPNFRDWQKENHSFSAMAIARPASFNLTGSGDAIQVNGEYVTSDFFSVLGVEPVQGRTLAPGEDEIGAAPVALISQGLWQRKFGSTPLIAGQQITLDNKLYTIAGVVPSSFHFPMAPFSQEREVFVPVGQWKNNLLTNRGAGLGFHGIARLKQGVTLEQASADMERVTSNLATAYPDANRGVGAKVIPMKQWMVGGIRTSLLLLFAAVSVVLLIVCVNVANLLLARCTARSREFAIRTALGASDKRLVQQLLTESLVFAALGGGLGLLLAAWGTQAALAALPTTLPRAEDVALDTRVLLFTIAISGLVGILVGLAPALKARTSNLQNGLKDGGLGAIRSGRHQVQRILVVSEIAMSLVLLAAAGLMIRTLQSLWSVDPGFDAKNVLTVGVSLPPQMMTAPADAVRNAFLELNEKVGSVPGVQAVSQSWGALPMGGDDEQTFWLEGENKPASENDMKWAIDYIVEPGYLNAMGLRLKGGRFFDPRDDQHAPRVIVVDDVFAKTYFPGQDVIGKRIRSNNFQGTAEIVGVVAHVRQWGLDLDDTEKLRAQMYLPCAQMSDAFVGMTPSGSTMIVRSQSERPVTLETIRAAVQQISNQHILFSPQTMREIISDSLARRRFMMVLLGVFAASALLLAIIGIYGVLSYIVGLRTHEIGVRIALGARRGDILRLILGGAGALTAVGVTLGLVAAFGLTRLMGSLLYGVEPLDPVTFAIVPGLVIAVTLLASYIPARRAATVDPMSALRSE